MNILSLFGIGSLPKVGFILVLAAVGAFFGGVKYQKGQHALIEIQGANKTVKVTTNIADVQRQIGTETADQEAVITQAEAIADEQIRTFFENNPTLRDVYLGPDGLRLINSWLEEPSFPAERESVGEVHNPTSETD